MRKMFSDQYQDRWLNWPESTNGSLDSTVPWPRCCRARALTPSVTDIFRTESFSVVARQITGSWRRVALRLAVFLSLFSNLRFSGRISPAFPPCFPSGCSPSRERGAGTARGDDLYSHVRSQFSFGCHSLAERTGPRSSEKTSTRPNTSSTSPGKESPLG